MSPDPSTHTSPASRENPGTNADASTSPLSWLRSSTPVPTQQEMEASRDGAASGTTMGPPPKPDAAPKAANDSLKRAHGMVDEQAERAASRQDGTDSDTAKRPTRGRNRVNSTDSMNTVNFASQDEGLALEGADLNPEGLSQQPPQSAQGPVTPRRKQKAKSQPKGSKSKKVTSRVPEERNIDEEAQEDVETSMDDEDASNLPEEQIEPFDWDGLVLSYHRQIADMGQQEGQIMDEFNGLLDFFHAWAVMGNRRDADRGFKRIKTQMTFVDHQEKCLELKRKHYIQVVNAFKSALELLTQQ
ncbi:hypothetical protein CERZMDRAFT_92717 [Cercospora zeae-maydis SCOH1-5]|uniref:Uncharacterized protein n=1 Tax=Cercospora zeae-maydis SCOH1-5 TaxID=717836 RepID=A0A6A6FXB9_9PEZI|nr:hypothetical protein CERZMDRAFT_92717 [Cercospora zeae-maydis SCOH1-5]